MKKLICLLVLVYYSCHCINSQIIKGYVMDEDSKSGISFAAVYFTGSYIGTNTVKEGYFELDISGNFSIPLTISALGYYSLTLSEYRSGELLKIYLKPKIFELSEVVVSARAQPFERKNNMSLFKKEFLGTSINAQNCIIENEDDIIFSYSTEERIFKAFATKPILITNRKLGYKIIYYLDNFEFHYPEDYGLISGQILGNYRFLENPVSEPAEQKRFERRRKITYMGSRMHFFRELWANRLDSTGFELMDSLWNKVNYSNIVIQSDGQDGTEPVKYLKYRGTLFLSYYSRSSASTVRIKMDHVYFNKAGYFDPFGIDWEGPLSDERIGDLLPYEYSPGRNNHNP